jgi:uncharacterized protein with HEPN domain
MTDKGKINNKAIRHIINLLLIDLVQCNLSMVFPVYENDLPKAIEIFDEMLCK